MFRGKLAGAAAALLVVVAAVTAVEGASSRSAAEPAPPTALGPVHVAGQTIRDAAGRQLLMRGMAVIDKDPSHGFVPQVRPADFARMRAWGFDSIRLGVIWAGVMPQQGVIDQHYVDTMAQLAAEAGQAGLRVIVDMHQDVWGEPWGDGAPLWAGADRPATKACPDLPIAKLTGSWGLQYASPDVNCAFTAFWLDPQLQALYTQAWVAVASAMRNVPAVAGYDLINEPWQGLIAPVVFETAVLYPAETRWFAAIRAVDPTAVGFFEPPSWTNIVILATPPLPLPAQAVFGPHLYGPWDDSSSFDFTRPLADLNFAYSRLQAQIARRPLWIGEWGTVASDAASPGFAAHVTDLMDQHLTSSSYWAYGLGDGYSPFNADGTPRSMMAGLAHGRAQAVAGDLRSTKWDVSTKKLTVSWTEPASMAGVASVLALPSPELPNGVNVSGATWWTYDAWTGQLTVEAAPGTVTITVTPR